MNIPEIGTTEKTPTSKYQVTLIDRTNRSLSPLKYPNSHRFFDNEEDRNTFLRLFETSIIRVGGRLAYNEKQSHFSFQSYDIFDGYGNNDYGLTIYR